MDNYKELLKDIETLIADKQRENFLLSSELEPTKELLTRAEKKIDDDAEKNEAEARAERMHRFIKSTDVEVIADLFTFIKDAIIEREADEVFYLSKYYKSVNKVIDDIEAEFFATDF